MIFDPEKYTMNEIKKILNEKIVSVNFFGDFTLQDVETAKKKLYFEYRHDYPMKEQQIKHFLETIANRLIEEKFSLTMKNPETAVLVKNTVKDTLNPHYKNTISRITQIDSQYRQNLLQCNINTNQVCDFLPVNETNFSSQLSDTLTNVISIKVDSISIPFTFYNIEARQGNHIFKFGDTYVEIEDGNYTIVDLISKIKTQINLIETNHGENNHVFDISYNYITGKVRLFDESQGNTDNFHILVFYDNNDIKFKNTKINNSLGWYLGFRDISCNGDNIISSLEVHEDVYIYSNYVCYLPNIKYFVITVDDHNNNQSNKSLVQLNQGKENIKNTNYYKNINEETNYYRNKSYDTSTLIDNDISGNVCLDTLKKTDLSPYTYYHRGLTKKQFYSQAAINETNNEADIKIIQEKMPNIMAIIPFEPKSLEWGKSIFFSDKNHYCREYHGPIDIEKLTIKIFDDKGQLLNLNGSEWSMTLVSKHIYKY